MICYMYTKCMGDGENTHDLLRSVLSFGSIAIQLSKVFKFLTSHC